MKTTIEQEYAAYSQHINAVKEKFKVAGNGTTILIVKLETHDIEFYFDGPQRTFGCVTDKTGKFRSYIPHVAFH